MQPKKENKRKLIMAETRGKNKNLVEAGNPRLLKKEVKGVTEYSLYLVSLKVNINLKGKEKFSLHCGYIAKGRTKLKLFI